MNRDDFLDRVRHSLGDLEAGRAGGARTQRPAGGAQTQRRAGGARRPYRPPPAPTGAELTELLPREHQAVGVIAYRAVSPEQARRRVLEILARCGARKVIRGDTTSMRKLDLDGELKRSGVEVTVADAGTTAPEQLRRAAFDADAGITCADFAVAETGTLALFAAPGQGRTVSLLPPIHVAVLDCRDVVYELAALFEKVKAKGSLPSALTLVTGPSRTGDIEQTLTIGVHGPGELHLVVID